MTGSRCRPPLIVSGVDLGASTEHIHASPKETGAVDAVTQSAAGAAAAPLSP